MAIELATNTAWSSNPIGTAPGNMDLNSYVSLFKNFWREEKQNGTSPDVFNAVVFGVSLAKNTQGMQLDDLLKKGIAPADFSKMYKSFFTEVTPDNVQSRKSTNGKDLFVESAYRSILIFVPSSIPYERTQITGNQLWDSALVFIDKNYQPQAN